MSFVKNYYLFFCVIVFGFVLRIVNLSFPYNFQMDESYYVPDSVSVKENGYEVKWYDFNEKFTPEESSGLAQNIINGNAAPFSYDFFASHPPLGKMLISLGMFIFGTDSTFGWRFSSVVFGTLIIAVAMMLAYIVFKSKTVALIAGSLIAVDPMSIAMSRIAHLDIFVTFFVILSVLFVTFFVRSILEGKTKNMHLFLAAVSLGLASAVKWSGVYYFVFFMAAVFVFEIFYERKTNKIFSVLIKYVTAGLIFISVYVSSWTLWIVSFGMKENTIFNAYGVLFQKHVNLLNSHSNLSPLHNYNSNAYEWFLQSRPTLLFFDKVDDSHVQFVSSMPNIIFWVLSIVAFVAFIILTIVKKQVLWSVLIVAVAAGWVPWMIYFGRTVFQFYTIIFQPYLYIVLAFMLYTVFVSLNNKFKIMKLFLMVVVMFGFIFSFIMYTGAVGLKVPKDNSSYAAFSLWQDFNEKYGLYDVSQSPQEEYKVNE